MKFLNVTFETSETKSAVAHQQNELSETLFMLLSVVINEHENCDLLDDLNKDINLNS